MSDPLQRRLNALILLCSALLGIVVTFLFFWERAGGLLLLYSLLPAGMIALVAFLYVTD